MIKHLLVCAYAYARERVIIGIFTHRFLDSNIPPPLSSFSNVLLFFSVLPDLCKKQPVIFSKRPVTFNKTTRHFQQNDPSFSAKQHVVFNKTTRRFQQNNASFSAKQRIIFTQTRVESNCSMIENNPQKGASLSDLICIFAMSIVGFSCFFCNTKISKKNLT